MIRKCYACGEIVSDFDKKCPKCGASQKSPKIVRRAGRAIKRIVGPLRGGKREKP
ncbi:hypothetical protein KKA14_20405 [bacterium]|nr:hypothetical protein [bacterium]